MEKELKSPIKEYKIGRYKVGKKEVSDLSNYFTYTMMDKWGGDEFYKIWCGIQEYKLNNPRELSFNITHQLAWDDRLLLETEDSCLTELGKLRKQSQKWWNDNVLNKDVPIQEYYDWIKEVRSTLPKGFKKKDFDRVEPYATLAYAPKFDYEEKVKKFIDKNVEFTYETKEEYEKELNKSAE